jgi:hypothetical protein
MNSTYCTDTGVICDAVLVPDTSVVGDATLVEDESVARDETLVPDADVATGEASAPASHPSNLMFIIETLDGSVVSVRCNDKKISEEACFVAVDHSNPEDGGGDNNRLFAKIDGVELESEDTYFVNDTIYNPKITVWAAF